MAQTCAVGRKHVSGWLQKDWDNKPAQLAKVLTFWSLFTKEHGASLADIIVLAGNVGVEDSSGMKVPFLAGRGDASEAQTDADSFAVLEPVADGFRNYQKRLPASPENAVGQAFLASLRQK